MKRWAKCILCGVLLTSLGVYALPKTNALGHAQALLSPGMFCAELLWPDGEHGNNELFELYVILVLGSNVALVSTILWLALWTIHRLKMVRANRPAGR